MERRSELTRRAPLAPGTKGLSRGAGLARGTGLTRSAPLAPGAVPLARQEPAPRARRPRVAPEVRDAVRARSRGRCEVRATDDCRRRQRRLAGCVTGAQQHHRLPARAGGSKRAAVHAAANLLDLCGDCHGHIESFRQQALAAGWLLREGQDPAAVPVLLWDGRRVLLGDTYTPVTG